MDLCFGGVLLGVNLGTFIQYCHISFPYIAGVAISANHQRNYPLSLHCAMCQYVECLLLMPLVDLVHGICHIAQEGQVGG